MNLRVIAAAAGAAVVAAAGATVGLVHLVTTTVPPAPTDWTSVFSDSFSGPAGSTVDSQWEFDDVDGTSNGSVQAYDTATANLAEDGSGHLDITPVKSGDLWTSSQVATVADDFAAPAGGAMEVSASIEQPDPVDGQGYWPAFWMLGADERTHGGEVWPADGEIDVLELNNAQSQNDNTFWYCAAGSETKCSSDADLSSGLYSAPRSQTSSDTYSVIIDRETSNETITWYLNGTQTYQVSESQVGTSQWHTAVDHGFYLILDVAIGGSFPGSPKGSTRSGAAMRIDKVAVYTTTGATPSPGVSAAPTPTENASPSGAGG